jgi:hypothetical protein
MASIASFTVECKEAWPSKVEVLSGFVRISNEFG